MVIELFLLPFTIFKWLFSLLVWLLLVSLIVGSDWFWDAKERIKDFYDDLTARWR